MKLKKYIPLDLSLDNDINCTFSGVFSEAVANNGEHLQPNSVETKTPEASMVSFCRPVIKKDKKN